MLALALFVALAAAPEGRVLLDDIVATVNGDIVTRSELRAAAQPYVEQNPGAEQRKRLYEDVLEQLVNERLIEQQIEAAKIRVSDSEVQAAIEDILRQNDLTRAQLLEALQARGMSLDAYEADVKQQLIRLKLIDRKVRSKVVIPEADLRAEYERRTRDEAPEVKVDIDHILLRFDPSAPEADKRATVARAREVRERVTAGGEAFAEVAKEVSQGPTAAKGGGLGELEMTSLLPALAEAVQDLEPGEISGPVLTPNGVHVLKLNRRRQEKATSFEELRSKIYQDLFQKRADEQMQLWLKDLERQSAVDIRLEE
jgi:peptidyl-prolyl cis-trans isomerase SurA